MKTIKLICVIAAIFLQSCLTESDPDLKKDFTSLNPVEIGDGWQLSNPNIEKIDSVALENIYKSVHNDADLWQIRSLLVFRNDKLVAESYMKDDIDRTKQRAIWSCTKQVTSILTGIAIEKGLITSLDDPIKKYLPDETVTHPDKQDITIRNLLMMQSGIGFNNDDHTGKFLGKHVDSSVEFVLSLPNIYDRGTVCNYNDGDPQIISAILQKVTGKPTDVWADEVLFSKLNFKNYSWHRYKDGITFGAFGLLLSPRELAKVALFVKHNGSVGNRQIISAEWIKEMTSSLTKNEEWDFGYYWWKDADRNISFMWGHGGQYAFIVPSKNLIVVITSEPNTNDVYQLGFNKAIEILDKIISACY